MERNVEMEKKNSWKWKCGCGEKWGMKKTWVLKYMDMEKVEMDIQGHEENRGYGKKVDMKKSEYEKT